MLAFGRSSTCSGSQREVPSKMKRILQYFLLVVTLLLSMWQHVWAQSPTTDGSLSQVESLLLGSAPKKERKIVRETRNSSRLNEQLRYIATAFLILSAASFIWIAVMFLVGLTLDLWESNSRTPFAMPHQERRPGEALLERAYLAVLTSALLVYYLTVPFVVLGLLTFAILRFLFLLLGMVGGRIFVNLIEVLQEDLKVAFGVFSSAFIGTSVPPRGLKVAPESNPKLFDVLNEVSRRLGSDPISAVYVTPTPDFSVHEAGSGPFGIFRRRRIMLIGISTISQLTISEFNAILAHEFAHFCHRDTFYTRFIYQVTKSLRESLEVLSGRGILVYLNPFFWFHWWYLSSLSMLSAGFSRFREFLADRRAVANYGKAPFTDGFNKIMFNDEFFGIVAVSNIGNRMIRGEAYVNVFQVFRNFLEQPDIKTLRNTLGPPQMTSRFSSHPTPEERLDAIQNFPDTMAELDSNLAIDLLSDRINLEERLTDKLSCEVGGFRGFSSLPNRIKRFDVPMPTNLAQGSSRLFFPDIIS